MYSHDYILEQTVSTDLYNILHSIDEMVKSDNPNIVFEKYSHLYTKMSNTKNQSQTKTHDFF